MVGMIFIAAGIVFVVVLALRLVPAYIEYATIRNHLRELARAPDTRTATPAEIRSAFGRRAQIDDIRSVSSADLDIERDGGDVILSTFYERRIKMIGNVSACIEFNATSE